MRHYYAAAACHDITLLLHAIDLLLFSLSPLFSFFRHCRYLIFHAATPLLPLLPCYYAATPVTAFDVSH